MKKYILPYGAALMFAAFVVQYINNNHIFATPVEVQQAVAQEASSVDLKLNKLEQRQEQRLIRIENKQDRMMELLIRNK